MLRDILRNDPQVIAVQQVVLATRPDVLILQNFDYDHDLRALTAFRDGLASNGLDYPYLFSAQPNSGVPSGYDLNRNGRLLDPQDRQGFGKFSGQGAMALLSRYPIGPEVQDFTDMAWKDVPQTLMTPQEQADWPNQRLSSVAHWAVPIVLPETQISILTFHATPPVFDGPDDLNGRRNHDEIRFWSHYLDGHFGPPPKNPIIIGVANIDPIAGEGRKAALDALMRDPRLQYLQPQNGQHNCPKHATVYWEQLADPCRHVSYILPSTDLSTQTSGVYWPNPATEGGADVQAASDHRLIWVDLKLDGAGPSR